MNFRYIKNFAPVAAVAMTMSLSSCVKDLDVTPIDPSTTMEVNEPALYAKCYANMALAGQGGANGDCDIDGLDGGTTGFVRQLWNANELTTDEAICCWGDTGIPAFNYNQWDSSHPMLQGFYYRLFAGIDYCNHYLDEDVCGGKNKEHTAEVRFLRALYYYYLMDCFANPPFATELSAESPKQTDRKTLFTWIEKELLECKADMIAPEARTSKDANYGRADQDAANLLLARMYLNAEVYTGTARWADAQNYAKMVIDGPHKLWTSGTSYTKKLRAGTTEEKDTTINFSAYQMLFMGDNGENGASQEAVLPLLQDGVTTTSWGTTLFLMASTWKSDMDVDSDYGTTEFWAGNRARKQLVDKFFPNGDAPQGDINTMVDAAKDDRALFYGVDRELHVTTPTEFTSGYSVGKYRNTYSTGATPHNSKYIDTDYFLMRSAEAYLIYAEAEARQNGGQTISNGAGTGYINQIRNRAGLSRSKQYATYSLDAILDETSREFYYEGYRRTNLVRYGYFNSNSYLWDWKGGSENGVGFGAYRNIFALPAEDVNANPNLKQNTGY